MAKKRSTPRTELAARLGAIAARLDLSVEDLNTLTAAVEDLNTPPAVLLGRGSSPHKRRTARLNGQRGGRPQLLTAEDLHMMRTAAENAGDAKALARIDRAAAGDAYARRVCRRLLRQVRP